MVLGLAILMLLALREPSLMSRQSFVKKLDLQLMIAYVLLKHQFGIHKFLAALNVRVKHHTLMNF